MLFVICPVLREVTICMCVSVDAAPPDQMLSAEALSGNVVFETAFYDDQTFLCKNSVRIFYV
ncbi:hypothetical protein EON65_28450 [archaeon]|nr:MAG: hypothetical protein EON65_28450 [archaeon]